MVLAELPDGPLHPYLPITGPGDRDGTGAKAPNDGTAKGHGTMTTRTLTLALLPVIAAAGLRSAAAQEPTRIVVRAVAHDAKVMGSGVGGALVVVRDPATGDTLARGIQEGSTGSTERIVLRPRERGATVYDTPGTARYLARLELTEPRRLEFIAEAPSGDPVARASKTMLVVPGEDVLGEGLILDLHGFTVELLAPEEDTPIRPGGTLPVRARVTMLCGCPTEPGGIWDADRIRIEARLVDGSGTVLARTRLTYAGEESTYEGTIAVPEEGRSAGGAAELRVVASDAERANFGIARLPLAAGS